MTDVRHSSIRLRSQTLHGERIVVVPKANGPGEHRIKAVVERNAYDFQSNARVSVWTSEKGFEHLASVGIEDCEIFGFSYQAKPGTWEVAMSKDLDRMIELGRQVLA